MNIRTYGNLPTNTFSRQGESESTLAHEIIGLVLATTRTPRSTRGDIRLGHRILNLLVADPDVPPFLNKEALKYREALRLDFPALFRRLYRTGPEIFTGKQIRRSHPCSVCIHPDVNRINNLIRQGANHTEIAMEFFLSEKAIGWHKKRHMPVEEGLL